LRGRQAGGLAPEGLLSMRVLLAEPPQADPAQPYTSLSVLAASWRRTGLEVDLRDWNVEFFNYLASPEVLQAKLGEVERRLGRRAYVDEAERAALARADLLGECLVEVLPKALAVLKDPVLFYDVKAYAWAIRFIARALDAISAPSYPGHISMQSFKTGHSHASSAGILAAIEDYRTNLFLPFCEDVIRRQLLERKPDVVAISVTFQTQLIPAWSIARRIRRWLPGSRVVLGGATITRIREGLRRTPQLLQEVDACVLFEGETAFPALLDQWQRGEDGLKAPNVMLSRGPDVLLSETSHTEDLDSLPPPDHEDLKLDQYWWPESALLINSSRGCYYGRCAFCMISPATWGPQRAGKSYRLLSAEKIVKDLQFVHQQTGARAFNLANDVLPPKTLVRIGELIRREQLDFTWDSEVRLEPGFSRPALQAMADGGCRHLRFGFETASTRVNKLMNKGTDLTVTNRILKDCRDAEIAVSLLCQIGFPGETAAEAWETVRFLERSRDLVSFVSLSQFALECGSQIHQQPSSFGVTLHPVPAWLDLAWTRDYTCTDGIDIGQTSVLFSELEEVLDGTYQDRDLFFKGGLGHAHTTLYTRAFPPGQFIDWNRRPCRGPEDFARVSAVRMPTRILIRRLDNDDSGTWSQVLISSAEVPELMVNLDGRLLLVLLAGSQEIPVPTVTRWVAYLLGDQSGDTEEARDVVKKLYDAGLFLSASEDARIGIVM
jgi:anaerobic magnesium-protoporphyrin IX monomethyl ester cyclase